LKSPKGKYRLIIMEKRTGKEGDEKKECYKSGESAMGSLEM
jgi:hypothetical protein